MDKKGDRNVSGLVVAADYENKPDYASKVLLVQSQLHA